MKNRKLNLDICIDDIELLEDFAVHHRFGYSDALCIAVALGCQQLRDMRENAGVKGASPLRIPQAH